jgi:hypothetical protein
MAKIAKVGYGSRGQGVGQTDGYTYVVNDNVRTGDIIQVVATSRAGRKFGTTGVPLATYKDGSVKAEEAIQDAESAGADVTRAYTAKELGVGGYRGRSQEEVYQKWLYERRGTKSATDRQPQSQRTVEVRGGNLARYVQENPGAELTKNAQETFDTYSKKFMQ